jgi:glycosyltransferase involved in cell wall biosynthesis
MKFDVVITTYKRPALTKAAILSCLNQGPLLGHVIVVDDASGDETASVVRSVMDPRVVFFERSANGGIAVARRDAFALSDADWTISLDSDHEMLPGCIEGMARLLTSALDPVDILGARYQWDTGRVTPGNVPQGVIGYKERIELSCRPNGIGEDYLCAISRRIRENVKWEPLRAGLPDVLFQLDIARLGNAIFSAEILAVEKTDGSHGWTRGSARQRWTRRCQDAADAVTTVQRILERHECALRRWGGPLLARLYREGAFYSILGRRRRQAWRWLLKSARLETWSLHLAGLTILSLMPLRAIKMIYLSRG